MSAIRLSLRSRGRWRGKTDGPVARWAKPGNAGGIGRNESFVHQFPKRGHPAELRERDREKLAQVLGIPPDDLRGPVTPLAVKHERTDIEELRERCRTYEFALCKIATEEPNSSAASLAAAALRLFE
jgi:hypothetical protein